MSLLNRGLTLLAACCASAGVQNMVEHARTEFGWDDNNFEPDHRAWNITEIMTTILIKTFGMTVDKAIETVESFSVPYSYF
jgi:hypothetical protein